MQKNFLIDWMLRGGGELNKNLILEQAKNEILGRDTFILDYEDGIKSSNAYKAQIAVLYMYTSLSKNNKNPSTEEVKACYKELTKDEEIQNMKPKEYTNTKKVDTKIKKEEKQVEAITIGNKQEEITWKAMEGIAINENGLYEGEGNMTGSSVDGIKYTRAGKRVNGIFTGTQQTIFDSGIHISEYDKNNVLYTDLHLLKDGILGFGNHMTYHFKDKDIVPTQDTKVNIENGKRVISGHVLVTTDDGSPRIKMFINERGELIEAEQEQSNQEKINTDTESIEQNNITTLTKEEAETLIEKRNKKEYTYLDLPKLTTIDEEVAKELAKFNGVGLNLNGLTTIDKNVAEGLTKFNGEVLYLNGLTEIDKNTAEKIASFGAKNNNAHLFLNGLTKIDKDVAKELAKFNGKALCLDGLTEIDKNIAKKLASFGIKNNNASLYLDGLTKIDKDVAKELAKFNGIRLSLDGLTKIDKDVAKELASFGGNFLFLDGLTKIDKDVAEELAKFNGNGRLYLRELDILHDGLGSFGGDLYLNSNIKVENGFFENFKGNLYLSGNDIDSSFIENINLKFKGELHFSGQINSNIIAQLCKKFDGKLCLDWLKKIDSNYIDFLKKFKGFLHLDGVKEVDADMVESFASLQCKYISLYGLEKVESDIANALLSSKKDYLLGITTRIDESSQNILKKGTENIIMRYMGGCMNSITSKKPY